MFFLTLVSHCLAYCSLIVKSEIEKQKTKSFEPCPGDLSWGSGGKESTCNVGDLGSIPGLGRFPGGGHSNPLQYSCLQNSPGQRSGLQSVWVTEGWTQLSN